MKPLIILLFIFSGCTEVQTLNNTNPVARYTIEAGRNDGIELTSTDLSNLQQLLADIIAEGWEADGGIIQTGNLWTVTVHKVTTKEAEE